MEIEKSTTDKSKLIAVVIAIILAGTFFGSLGYLLGNKESNTDKPKNQIVKDEDRNQDIEVEEEEIDNEEKEGIENIEDETADWKSFVNEDYGFEVEYSKEWNVKDFGMINLDNPSVVGFSPNKINDMNVEISVGVSNTGIVTLLEKSKYSIGNQVETTVKIDGFDAIKINGTEMGKDVVVLYMNLPKETKNVLVIKLNDISELSKFNQMLSTFKFTGTNETADWQTYTNDEYGFEITLLDSWKGYLTLTESWNGTTLDGKSTKYQGPQIIIRNPKWSTAQPWQDIPVMVFTKEEWELIEAKNLNVNAAPVGPEKLDENQKYVFALPPRWIGYSDALGQNEAQEIAETIKAISF